MFVRFGCFPLPSMTFQLSYLGIVVAALAAFVFGFLVHGPLFGKQWMALMKITPEQMEKGRKDMEKKMPLYMLAAFGQQLVVAAVTSHLAYNLYVVDVLGAVMLGFLLWLGYVATVLLNGVLWEGRTKELYAFNVAYQLASLVIVAVIVTVLQ